MAEPAQAQPGAPAPAAGEELSIPKHRFDEVNNEVRRLREDIANERRLYSEERQRMLAATRQPPAAEITPEETGLDPQVHQAVVKVAEKIAGKRIAEMQAVHDQQIGILAGRTEKAELLAARGSDKAKYLPEIQARQQEHFRTTGGFLPADIALEMIQSKEKDDRIRALEAKLAGNPPPAAAAPGAPAAAPAAAAPAAPSGGVPSAAGTRQMPGTGGGSPAPAQPSPEGTEFGKLSLAEMEARLEAEFGKGTRL